MKQVNLLSEVQCELRLQGHFEGCDYAALQLESLADRGEALTDVAIVYKDVSLEDGSVALQDIFGAIYEQQASQRTVSMEVIKEALEKIWQAIKNAIWRLIRATKDFFYDLLKGTRGMLKKITALRDKVESVKAAGLMAPTKPITVTGGSRLHMGGTIDVKELIEGVENGVTILSQTKTLYLEGAFGLVDSLEGLTDRLLKVDERSAASLQTDIRALSTYPSQISVDMDSLMKSLRSRELPGGKLVEVELTKYTPRGIPRGMPDLAMVDYQKRTSYRERDQVPVPELDDLSELLDRTEELVNVMVESNERSDTLATRYERVVERAEDLFDRQSIMFKLKEYMHEHTVELLMRFYQMAMPTAIHRLGKYEFSVARATLAYINDCLNSYEPPR